jgi:hypothetical protein
MSKAIDHTGVRYGKAVGISPTEKAKYKQKVWLWKCDCGNEFESVAGNFVYDQHSNGCPACVSKNKGDKTREHKTTHGLSKSKEHKSWCKIKERCFNPNDKEYPNYGAVGITMFEGWKNSFQDFINYMGLMPDDGKKYSCDRIDNKKGYFPENVRWATYHQQARNKGLQKNNTTGKGGVMLDNKGKGQIYYKATWRNLNGKQENACYSIKKYGEELAFFLACEKRDLEIMKLNLLGAGYSENHGK